MDGTNISKSHKLGVCADQVAKKKGVDTKLTLTLQRKAKKEREGAWYIGTSPRVLLFIYNV